MATKKSSGNAPEARTAGTDPALEAAKAAGQTDSQREMREYHEGEFQTTDPITREPRDADVEVRPLRVDRGESLDTGATPPATPATVAPDAGTGGAVKTPNANGGK